MPSLGLLLENPLFDSYNQRTSAGVNQKLQPSDTEYRHPVDFEMHRGSMEEFKQRHIYDNLRQTEDRDGMSVVQIIHSEYFLSPLHRFDAWIRNVDSYGGDDLLYLNPEGVIPDVCVIKKGEKRSKPFQEVVKPKGEDADAPSPAGDEDED